MTLTLGYWLLTLLPCLPVIGLSLSYRRIVDQKTREVLRRLTALPDLYTAAYGSASAHRNRVRQDQHELTEELREFYNWRTYYVPAALLCLVAVGLTVVAFLHFGIHMGFAPAFEARVAQALTTTIVAAGAAYLWSLNDLIRRHRSADISSSSLHSAWLRILICAAVGGALGDIFSARMQVIAALAVGGLPIEDIKQWIASRTDLTIASAPTQPPDMHLLQGTPPSTIDRLRDEEIERVQTLAFADPVRLLFRTNIEWNVILDLVDQAMLINVVGEKIGKLRDGIGIRCAIEVASLYQQIALPDPADPEEPPAARRAEGVFAEIAKALGVTTDVAMHIGYQFYHDPLLQFVWNHWEEARKLGASDADGQKDAAA